MCSDDISVPIDDGERGPRSHGVGTPDAKLAVIDDRMAYLIPQRSLTNPGRIALGDIFAAMNSDDDDVVGELLFNLPQLRKNVNTVYSAVSPEIEKDHLAPQLCQCERFSTSVNPVEARRKLGCTDAG